MQARFCHRCGLERLLEGVSEHSGHGHPLAPRPPPAGSPEESASPKTSGLSRLPGTAPPCVLFPAVTMTHLFREVVRVQPPGPSASLLLPAVPLQANGITSVSLSFVICKMGRIGLIHSKSSIGTNTSISPGRRGDLRAGAAGTFRSHVLYLGNESQRTGRGNESIFHMCIRLIAPDHTGDLIHNKGTIYCPSPWAKVSCVNIVQRWVLRGHLAQCCPYLDSCSPEVGPTAMFWQCHGQLPCPLSPSAIPWHQASLSYNPGSSQSLWGGPKTGQVHCQHHCETLHLSHPPFSTSTPFFHLSG